MRQHVLSQVQLSLQVTVPLTLFLTHHVICLQDTACRSRFLTLEEMRQRRQ